MFPLFFRSLYTHIRQCINLTGQGRRWFYQTLAAASFTSKSVLCNVPFKLMWYLKLFLFFVFLLFFFFSKHECPQSNEAPTEKHHIALQDIISAQTNWVFQTKNSAEHLLLLQANWEVIFHSARPAGAADYCAAKACQMPKHSRNRILQ